LKSILEFICRFGVAALEGRPGALSAAALGTPRVPLPLDAAALFRDLERNAIPNLKALAERIESLVSKETSVFKRRVAQLTLLALLPALISIPIFMRIAAFIMSMEPPTLMAPLMTAFTCVLLFLMALGALVSGTLFRGGATVRLFG